MFVYFPLCSLKHFLTNKIKLFKSSKGLSSSKDFFISLSSIFIALIISKEANSLLKANPDGYSNAGNHKAGRICAIIGTSLSAIYVLILIVYFIFLGVAISEMPGMY